MITRLLLAFIAMMLSACAGFAAGDEDVPMHTRAEIRDFVFVQTGLDPDPGLAIAQSALTKYLGFGCWEVRLSYRLDDGEMFAFVFLVDERGEPAPFVIAAEPGSLADEVLALAEPTPTRTPDPNFQGDQRVRDALLAALEESRSPAPTPDLALVRCRAQA